MLLRGAARPALALPRRWPAARWRGPPGLRFAATAYHLVSHTTLQRASLQEAIQECTAQLPRDRAPSLVAIVLSRSPYADQIEGTQVQSLLPPSPVIVCCTEHHPDPLIRFMLGVPEDQLPTIVTVTALYLPPDHPCCAFFTTTDAIPPLRINAETKMPLARYLGQQGEKLHFLMFTPERAEAVHADPAYALQRRLYNVFPNADVTWMSLPRVSFQVQGETKTDGVAGLAISFPDVEVVAELLLRMFSHFPVSLLMMRPALFARLFNPAVDQTRLSGPAPPLHHTLWRGLFPFVTGEYQFFTPEVVRILEAEGGVVATKVTGDDFVPAGEINFVVPTLVTEYGSPAFGHLQTAEFQFTNSAFLRARVTRHSPAVLEVEHVALGVPELATNKWEASGKSLPAIVLTQLTAPQEGPDAFGEAPLPVFHVPGALVMPEGVARFNVFEARYRRMLRQALETGGLVGMVDTQATVRFGPTWVIGTACRVLYCDSTESKLAAVVLQGVGRFRIESGGGRLSDFGLASVRCAPLRDEPVPAHQAEEGWGLAEQFAKTLKYNPLEEHLRDCPRTAEMLSKVSFVLANQGFDEKFAIPKVKGTTQVSSVVKTEAEARGAFIYRMLIVQDPIKRLKFLLVE